MKLLLLMVERDEWLLLVVEVHLNIVVGDVIIVVANLHVARDVV